MTEQQLLCLMAAVLYGPRKAVVCTYNFRDACFDASSIMGIMRAMDEGEEL